MLEQQPLAMFTICLLMIPLALTLTSTTEPSTVSPVDKTTTSGEVSSATTAVDEKETSTAAASTTTASSSSTEKASSTTATSTQAPPSTSTSADHSSSTTTTAQPQYSTEWQDIEETESQKLVSFVVSEIQKLKVEHKELDECQELDLSSVLSGKKLNGKAIKYSVTLKVQPQVKNTEECLKQNATMANMHPEICEADVTEGDRGGTDGKTLLRSTCLQVEELQD